MPTYTIGLIKIECAKLRYCFHKHEHTIFKVFEIKIIRKVIGCKMAKESNVDKCLEWTHGLLMRSSLLRSWRAIHFYNFQVLHEV